jgi:putative membrane protein
MIALCAAALLALVALSPPMDRLADSSFAWHMAQHLLLLYAIPLLVLLARPFEWFASWAGKARTAAFVRATRPLHVLCAPPVALVGYVAVLWLAHFSALYELALEHPLVHVAEHALFLLAGTLFWIPVVAPPPIRPPSYVTRLLYLVVALPQGAFLGAALTSSGVPLYKHYVATLGAAKALVDQQNAGAVMWIGGGLTIFVALLATLGAWAMRERDSEEGALQQ